MLLKYTLYTIDDISTIIEYIESNGTILVVYGTLFYTLGPICHWTYTS